LWKGGEGFIRTHGGIDCIVIAVGYRVPFRFMSFRFMSFVSSYKGCSRPVFRATGVIATDLLGPMLRRVIPCCLASK
jgi:hypothetical protein